MNLVNWSGSPEPESGNESNALGSSANNTATAGQDAAMPTMSPTPEDQGLSAEMQATAAANAASTPSANTGGAHLTGVQQPDENMGDGSSTRKPYTDEQLAADLNAFLSGGSGTNTNTNQAEGNLAPPQTFPGPAQPSGNIGAGSSTVPDWAGWPDDQYIAWRFQGFGTPNSTNTNQGEIDFFPNLAGSVQPAGNTGADSGISSNTMAEPGQFLKPWVATPQVALTGPAQQQGHMGADSSAYKNAAPQQDVAVYATPTGDEQPPVHNGADMGATSGYTPQQVVPNAGTFNGFAQQPEQGGVDMGANYDNAPQYPPGSLEGPNGNQLPFYGQENAAFDGGFDDAAFVALLQGAMLDMAPEAMAGAPAPAPPALAPVAARRSRQRNQPGPDHSRVKKSRAAPRQQTPAQAGPAQNIAAVIDAALAEQQPAAPVGMYVMTKAGVLNRDPTVKGNAQGQYPGWAPATKFHHGRCEMFVPNGCKANCQLQALFPQTCAQWAEKRFQIRWNTARGDRPQTETVNGFFIDGKKYSEQSFVVLGEVHPVTGALDKKSKTVHRVDNNVAA